MATASSIWPSAHRTAPSPSCLAMAMARSPQRPLSRRVRTLSRSPWATSMATANPTWPSQASPTFQIIRYRFSRAMAMEHSRLGSTSTMLPRNRWQQRTSQGAEPRTCPPSAPCYWEISQSRRRRTISTCPPASSSCRPIIPAMQVTLRPIPPMHPPSLSRSNPSR